MFVLMSSVLVGSANNFRELQKPFQKHLVHALKAHLMAR